jgi:hypothetical protein
MTKDNVTEIGERKKLVKNINDEVSPNAILGMLLSNVDNIKNIGFVIEWKKPLPEGQYAGGFSYETTPEQGAMYIKVLEHTYNSTFLSYTTASSEL